jgi:hypothetical protein
MQEIDTNKCNTPSAVPPSVCFLLYIEVSLAACIIISYDVLKIKVNLFLCLTKLALRHVDLWGSGCINPHFLDLGISWR